MEYGRRMGMKSEECVDNERIRRLTSSGPAWLYLVGVELAEHGLHSLAVDVGVRATELEVRHHQVLPPSVSGVEGTG